jgi:hypothetical protein
MINPIEENYQQKLFNKNLNNMISKISRKLEFKKNKLHNKYKEG